MRKKNITRITIGTALLLLMPLIAMQFTDEVDWNLADFLVMGLLLLAAGFAYEFLATRKGLNRYRYIIAIVAITVLALAWMELAVGVFNTPWAGS